MTLNEDKLIANPDQFQATVLDKSKSNNADVKYVIGSGKILAVSSVEVLQGRS